MELDELQFIDTCKLQEGNGVYHVTVPKDLVNALNMQKGDQVLFAYDGESEKFEARPMESRS